MVTTKSKLGISVWPSGKCQFHLQQAPFSAIEAVESMLTSTFKGAWISDSEMREQEAANPRVVVYGVQSELARSMGQLFR